MNYDEFKQLKAYSWYDGIYLSVLWIASFACLIGLSATLALGTLFQLLVFSTPFFVAYRLSKYRREGLGGHISFSRALAYCLRVFFNAAMLFAIAQWAYMRFVDNGQLVMAVQSAFSAPGSQDLLQQVNLNPQDIVDTFAQASPLEFAASYFLNNVMVGTILSIPIALVMRKSQATIS